MRPPAVVSIPPQTEPEDEWEDDAPTIGPTPIGPFANPAAVGKRLSWLAKDALVNADAAALEQYTAGLRATGGHSRYAERLQALAGLQRGDVGDALRILRNARADLEGQAGPLRTQAALALALALAASGRMDEALLEALDGLARARLGNDSHGSLACLAFLSKLYGAAGRVGHASEIREALERAGGLSP
jgi:ATP/maltotriose-dependent transcriptional regulator MalT